MEEKHNSIVIHYSPTVFHVIFTLFFNIFRTLMLFIAEINNSIQYKLTE